MDWERVSGSGGGGGWRDRSGSKVWSGSGVIAGSWRGETESNGEDLEEGLGVAEGSKKWWLYDSQPKGWRREMGKGRTSMLRKCWSGPSVGAQGQREGGQYSRDWPW